MLPSGGGLRAPEEINPRAVKGRPAYDLVMILVVTKIAAY